MTPAERSLVLAVMALVLALLCVRFVGEWLNGGWHSIKRLFRKHRHRFTRRRSR
jgi:hypothetical protein